MLFIEIITPEHTVFRGEADSVSLPTPNGEITVLPKHIPLVSIVHPGSVLIRRGNESSLFAVSHGVTEIDGTNVRMLTDTADRAEDLQEQVIEEARKRAEALKKERREDEEEYAALTATLERELARLKVVRRHRPRIPAEPPPQS